MYTYIYVLSRSVVDELSNPYIQNKMLIHFSTTTTTYSFFFLYIFFVSTWKRVYEFLALFYIEYLCRLSLSLLYYMSSAFFSFFLQFNYLMSFILLLLYYIFSYRNIIIIWPISVLKRVDREIFDGRTMSFEFFVVWCVFVPIWNNILVLLLLIVFQFYSTFSILFSSFYLFDIHLFSLLIFFRQLFM